MKVLWLVNILLPQIGILVNKQSSSFGGWVVSLFQDILTTNSAELVVCCPANDNIEMNGITQGFNYYIFSTNSQKQVANFKSILVAEDPDIIQIFGTEYIHSYNMLKACEELGLKNKVLVHVQGLLYIYAKHYFANLPNQVINGFTVRDLIRLRNVKFSQLRMLKSSEPEKYVIREARHITGRTDWDKACVLQLNPTVNYHFCNESLRGEFYKNIWSLERCERFSIFVSQMTNPIKGFHLILEAMPLIIKQYPYAKIYVTGKDIFNLKLKDQLKISFYQKYLIKLIRRNNLQRHIEFVGVLDEHQMVNRFLKSHVFVSASSIENSPNSVGEAMILGVPIVSSDVGGVKDMLTHKVDGYIYQSDATYMLAYYVCDIFSNDHTANMFSQNARSHAMKTHDKAKNLSKLLDVYKTIMCKNI